MTPAEISAAASTGHDAGFPLWIVLFVLAVLVVSAFIAWDDYVYTQSNRPLDVDEFLRELDRFPG